MWSPVAVTEGLYEDLDEPEFGDEVILDPNSQAFVTQMVDGVITFMHELIGFELFPYQLDFGRRLIESVLINDGEEVTALFSRQSGKSETVADVVAALMILLPRLALMFPENENLAKFKKGFWVGMFAPTDDQVETLFSRCVTRLSADRATEVMMDPEVDDIAEGKGKVVKLKKSGSFCRMQTANPRAKIESKSYHLIIVDEAQDTDDYVIRKSVHPMGAFYNATLCKTGTPTTRKGDFYKAIQHNKRRQTKRGHRVNHFEADWKYCAKHNKNYERYVKKEMKRLGEDSDEFQLAYALKWLLERGMFLTSSVFDDLGDLSMEIVRAWWKTPVLVGVDPARSLDSTVVTVVWVDWDRPDEFGFYDHRVLNWLELHGDQWEEQYGQIMDFLANYNVLAGAVDSQGVGDAVADRLARLMPRTEWHALASNRPDQSDRWKHLKQLVERKMVGWPAHAKTRRLKAWQRFKQQMIDLEKKYEGAYLLAEAPEEPEAHDDYPDSLALACYLTAGLAMPEVEVSSAPFYENRRERYEAGRR